MTTTLSVWTFATSNAAEHAESLLLRLESERLISVDDAAFVSWQVDPLRPESRQVDTRVGPGTLSGSFWRLLFDVIFVVPVPEHDRDTGPLATVGIHETFIDGVRTAIPSGTAALFVLTSGSVIDEIAAAFEDFAAEPVEVNLGHREQDALRELFGA